MRTLARTDTFMPMKPAAPESTAPIAKPIATSEAEEIPDDQEDHDPDDADGGVLALEIGLRALAHGGGNLLHPRVAGVRRQHDWVAQTPYPMAKSPQTTINPRAVIDSIPV